MIERLSAVYAGCDRCVSAAVGHAAESADCEILGIGYLKQRRLLVFGLAMVVTAAMFIMSRSNVTFLRQYAILLSLAGGWILFAVFGAAKPIQIPDRIIQLPALFRLENPCLTVLIITSLFITVLLIVNMLASIRVVEAAVKNSAAPLGSGVSVRQGLRLRSATF